MTTPWTKGQRVYIGEEIQSGLFLQAAATIYEVTRRFVVAYGGLRWSHAGESLNAGISEFARSQLYAATPELDALWGEQDTAYRAALGSVVGPFCWCHYRYTDTERLWRALEDADTRGASTTAHEIRAELMRRYPKGLAWQTE